MRFTQQMSLGIFLEEKKIFFFLHQTYKPSRSQWKREKNYTHFKLNWNVLQTIFNSNSHNIKEIIVSIFLHLFYAINEFDVFSFNFLSFPHFNVNRQNCSVSDNQLHCVYCNATDCYSNDNSVYCVFANNVFLKTFLYTFVM